MRRLEDLLQSALDPANAASPGPIDESWNEPEPDPTEGTVCPHCRGARFVRRDVDLSHPEFGRAVPCVCVQEEREEERSARLQRYSNLGALGRYTFETMMPRGRSANVTEQERYQRAVAAAQEFARAPEGWLILRGESGCGKTHLAASIANAAIAAGQACLFMVVPDLLDHLRAAYGPASEVPYDRLFEQVRSAPLLVLDDLGSQSATAWAEEKLFQIINHRFQSQLPTVVTLATPPERLEERLRTRLTDPSVARVYLLEAGGGEASEMPDLLSLPMVRLMTFANFNDKPTGPDLPDHVARRLELALRIARTYAQHPDGWLVLAGGTGSGKTHLAAAIAHQQRVMGRPHLFVVVPDLLDRLRADMRGDRDRPDYIEHVRTCDFLVLDDLGVHSATEWAQEKLYQILNYRYNAKLPTVITVRSTDELPSTWVSRMRDEKVGMFHEIQTPDYRDPGRSTGTSARRDRRGR